MTLPTPPLNQRLLSIDALRGLVILFMLLDHVRETFFLHRQVADPMNIEITDGGNWKVQAKLTRVNSSSTRNSPRLNRNAETSRLP